MIPLLSAEFPIMVAGSTLLAHDLQFTLYPGDIIGLTGPNGCGKSVTLDCISGLRTVARSSVMLSGSRIDNVTMFGRWMRGMRRLFQQPSLAEDTSIASVMEHYSRVPMRGDPAIGRKLVYAAGLNLGQMVGSLSYGQRRLVEIASLAQSGTVFLLDEPFAGVAVSLIPEVHWAVQQLSTVGAVLIVDHSIDRLKALATGMVVWPSQEPEQMSNCERPPSVTFQPLDDISRSAGRVARWQVQHLVAGERLLAREVAIEMCPGELLYILGPNGSGKSTLLRTLAGLPQPHGITCRGVLSDVNPMCIHFSPQPPKLVRSISVWENLFLMWPRNRQDALARLRCVRSLMQSAGVPERLLDMRADRLSGGESGIMSLVGAAASGRSVLMLDEPFEGLSAVGQKYAASLIRTLLYRGVVVIVTAHSVQLDGVNARRIQLTEIQS